MNHDEIIYSILSKDDGNHHIIARESTTLEFKESFTFSSMQSYAKTMAAFSNNKGGYLLFGISDNPRKAVGTDKDVFNSIRIEDFTQKLNSFFSPYINWDIGGIVFDNIFFGYIYTFESKYKPVICMKESGILKEGDIYYRYRGQSRRATYVEILRMIEDIRANERELWLKHIEKIGKIGPNNLALLNLSSGDIETTKIDEGQLIIDSELLNELVEKVGLIEEGKFVESEGAPVLKIIGDIRSSQSVLIPKLDPNKDFPYRMKELAEELGISQYFVQVLVWKYGVKNRKDYHIEINAGNNTLHKFSSFALNKLKEIVAEIGDDEVYMDQVSKEFSNR